MANCIYKYKGKDYTKEEFYSLVSNSNFIQQEQAKKFAELQERLNNKEFLEGAKNAFESSEELQNVYYEALEFKTINESEITYTDDEGNPCAVNGLKGSKFKKGGKWEIIKEFKGKSHAQGGIDIEIGKGGIKMSNKQGKFEAKYGLIIPKNN